jgi:peroxiredoxin
MMLMNRLLKPGEQAPAFRLLDHRGFSLGLEDFSEQNGLVLIFFSSDWLKADIELLQRYHQAYTDFQAKGLALLAISGINWETLHLLAQRLQVPFPLIFDPCCRYSARYGSMWVPKYVTGRSTYALSPQGHVLFSRRGVVDPSRILAMFQ